jgi:hypothetical protein
MTTSFGNNDLSVLEDDLQITHRERIEGRDVRDSQLRIGHDAGKTEVGARVSDASTHRTT